MRTSAILCCYLTILFRALIWITTKIVVAMLYLHLGIKVVDDPAMNHELSSWTSQRDCPNFYPSFPNRESLLGKRGLLAKILSSALPQSLKVF